MDGWGWRDGWEAGWMEKWLVGRVGVEVTG